jgi:hypothetical protein
MTPWASGQPVARPLPTQGSRARKTRTNIHALNEIRTQDPNIDETKAQALDRGGYEIGMIVNQGKRKSIAPTKITDVI